MPQTLLNPLCTSPVSALCSGGLVGTGGWSGQHETMSPLPEAFQTHSEHGGRADVPVRVHVYMRAQVLGVYVCASVNVCVSEPVAHVWCVCMYTCRVWFVCTHVCIHTCVGVCSHVHTPLGSLTWEEAEIGTAGGGTSASPGALSAPSASFIESIQLLPL